MCACTHTQREWKTRKENKGKEKENNGWILQRGKFWVDTVYVCSNLNHIKNVFITNCDWIKAVESDTHISEKRRTGSPCTFNFFLRRTVPKDPFQNCDMYSTCGVHTLGAYDSQVWNNVPLKKKKKEELSVFVSTKRLHFLEVLIPCLICLLVIRDWILVSGFSSSWVSVAGTRGRIVSCVKWLFF